MELSQFINKFQFTNKGSIVVETAKPEISQLSEDQLDILQSELVEYISDLNFKLEDMELTMPVSVAAEYYGSYLYDIEPTDEYNNLLKQISKAQEVLNVCELCEEELKKQAA